ncbi:MAG: SDR family NAD(P)-dependent oxidoreductase [Cytophagales bacterium]|nr:MAG: SDR family NAD(P)-dependent oxidoreductase [Cytophagales bacterium]
MEQKTILLTGAAGFIGSVVAQKLLEIGHQVIGIDNLNDYYDVKLKFYRLDNLKKYPYFHFYHQDIENLSELQNVFAQHKNIDAILNLAARAGVRYSMENPHVYMTTNANATLNLLEMMRQHEIKKMVLASTSSLYAGQPLPFTEKLPVNTPISPYAASKKAAEMMAYTYHYLFGLDISVVRYFTVYGPAGRPDMSIFRFTKWIDEGTPIELFGDGEQSRDFTYVDDIANGTIAAMKPVGYEVFNLGGGREPMSMNQVIRSLEKLLGKKALIDHKPFHKADITDTQADISKAKHILGWQPQVAMSEGVAKTTEWYLANKTWLKDIKL